MKLLLHVLVIAAFCFNGLAVNAWAKPCSIPNDSPAHQITKMPCHGMSDAGKTGIETQASESPDPDPGLSGCKHCDGVCLCLHASLNHTPLEPGIVLINSPHITKQMFYPPQVKFSSIHGDDLFRPPKV